MLIDGSKVAVIVTTYNPVLSEFQNNLGSYLTQVGLVIVCDNSELGTVSSSISCFCAGIDNLHYLSMGGNKGIAFAQNRGVEFALSRGFDYFLEIDQDSSLQPDYIKNILSSFTLLVSNNIPIAGIGPLAKNSRQDFIYGGFSEGKGIEFVDQTLSSGFLYSKDSFFLLGPKDESLFIDLVDWEWCWRAKSFGMVVAIDTNLVISHMLGDGHTSVLGFKIGMPSPIRLYYQYRNSLYMFGKNYVSASWKFKRLFILVAKLPFFLLFADKRIERLKYIAKGFWGFIQGVSGKV